jgi:hypothetical protein
LYGSLRCSRVHRLSFGLASLPGGGRGRTLGEHSAGIEMKVIRQNTPATSAVFRSESIGTRFVAVMRMVVVMSVS